MKPSSHFVRYDAQTYSENGFIEMAGRVRDLAQEPRFWQVTASKHIANQGFFSAIAKKPNKTNCFRFNPW